MRSLLQHLLRDIRSALPEVTIVGTERRQHAGFASGV